MFKLSSHFFPFLCFLTAQLSPSLAKTVEYDLYVRNAPVNFTGVTRPAMTINGSIPGPTLHFTEGDTAVIRVHNMMDTETSFHWHGLLVPNDQDGVPYLTSAPVKPHTTHTYTFPIIQNGTYWYHSHSGLQEQSGLYGAFVIRKRPGDLARRMEDALPEYTLVLSDWTNENPNEVNRKLHTGSDWFSIRKGSVQSYWEALRAGYLGTKLTSEWKRMNAMDVSDVFYNRFLLNGTPQASLPRLKGGDRIRLRIVNGASSTYFWLRYAGGKIRVVASDGKDVVPVDVDRMMIAVSETYDVILTVPESGKSFEFQATAEDTTGSSSLWLGHGERQPLRPFPKLNYFKNMKQMNGMMTMGGNMKMMKMNSGPMPHQMHHHGMSGGMPSSHSGNMGMTGMKSGSSHGGGHGSMQEDGEGTSLTYDMLKSPSRTNLPSGVPVKELHFMLTGNMNRYVWSMNGKTLSETDRIMIKEGQNVRIVLTNNTMMRHPMHLHGHFFRLVNRHGDFSPLKFTADIQPMATQVIEFNAAEKTRGNWFFHCHILYHMMSGMGRIFTYEDSPPNPQLPHPMRALQHVYDMDRMWYLTVNNDFASNGNIGDLEFGGTRWSIQGEWQIGYKDTRGYEAEGRFGRYIGEKQWLYPYIGVDWTYRKGEAGERNMFRQTTRKDREVDGTLGARYTLPLFLIADARIDTDGKVRLQLERDDIPLTSRLRLSFSLNTDRDYSVGLHYILTSHLSISTNYDNNLHWGVGLMLTY
ncbi:multicopper oxidase domain-containing protein [uncultured Akkermansia sp.]|uniref:multicopper oxidase domain-containing protein n=1 Tax=uncultured Akkermansia sp. TaxID=512294 RepID=UPI0025D160DE|nr:multicopper oxidase domain-containing protein [uncultured Akkermansia sp.]